MGPVGVSFRRCAVGAAACAAVLALAAVPSASAKPSKCTDKQIYAGKCGKLPIRSCAEMISASRFNAVTIDQVLAYEDPSEAPHATPANERQCDYIEDLKPYAPDSEEATVIDLFCAPVSSCDFATVATIQLVRERSAAEAEQVLTNNFCVTETTTPLVGRDVYIHGAGRKACINNKEGSGNMAADNYFVHITGFGEPDTDLTPADALKIIAKKLLG